MKKPVVYNESAILELSDISHIRLRPSGYIPSVDSAGIAKICFEILDNATDEIEFLGKGMIDIFMFINPERNNFEMVIMDTGRGVPIGKMIPIFSSSKVSGKFNTDHYRFSSGLYGFGATVTLALSSWFRAISLQDKIGDVIMRYDNIPTAPDITTNPFKHTGTMVMFSPDKTIFPNISEFIADHSAFTEHLIHLNLFGNCRIRFTEINQSLSNAIKKASAVDVIQYIESLRSSVTPNYDSDLLNKPQYIKSYFGITNWHGLYNLPLTVNNNDTLRVQGEIGIFTGSISATQKNKLTFVNNLLFDDNNSLHTSILIKFIKQRMAINISDKLVKSFFIDHYKLPIFLVLDIKFSAAQFSGFAKSSFKDLAFRQPYQSLLNTLITDDIISDMYRILMNHIEIAYNKFSNKDFVVSGSMKNIMSRLNRPDKFDDCGTNDRSIAELFLVEGDSANGDEGRDSNFQASYTLGGKPFNGLTTPDKLGDSVNAIKRNAVFQDIIRILNITPGNDDLSNLNFYKIFIMADADTHGYHITDIVISNLFAVCPALITNGHVYVIKPPLYSLNIKGNAPIYIQDSEVLNTTLAYQVYYRCIDITIQSDTYTHTLNREEFAAFSELVVKIGDELERLSVEYMIPAFLLEMLSLMTSHLNLRQPNVQLIQEYLGCEVRYVSAGHLLVVSIGSDDIVVPLNQITELLYTRILPLYREFYYGRTRLFVTTKNSDAMKNQPTSIIQIYEIFKRLSGMFTIKRYKGLGSMPPKDRAINCLNPATRNAFQITSIGNIKTIFNMMGSDPTERKRLVLA